VASFGDPSVRDFLAHGTRTGKRNAVPGELVVRLRPLKVLAKFDITG
jgi:hypothetical protein